MGAFRHRQQRAELVYDLIPPERGASSGQAHRLAPKPDIVDAEFVTVSGGRSRGASAGVNMRYERPAGTRPQLRKTRSNGLSRVLAGFRFIENVLQQASRRSFVALIVSLAILIFRSFRRIFRPLGRTRRHDGRAAAILACDADAAGREWASCARAERHH